MKRIALGIITGLLLIVGYAMPVLATALPSTTPSVSHIYIYRNSLETGDFFMMIDENTPYTTVPTDYTYPQAFVWRLIDTDGTTEIAQALGYVYNDSGYGYNLISFYLSAAEVTAAGITWGDNLFVRLSGTPVAFATPPIYNFNVEVGDYSSLTDTGDVQAAIAAQILALANSFDSRWGLTGTTSLLVSSETGTNLSLYGQAFFRGAIYGVQAIAPAAFSLVIQNINLDPRLWSDNYSSTLAAQLAGTSLNTALNSGNQMLAVGWNMFGFIIVIVIIASLIVFSWVMAGGNLWRGFLDGSPILIIAGRIGLLTGLGIPGLAAALCWIYISAKMWRMV